MHVCFEAVAANRCVISVDFLPTNGADPILASWVGLDTSFVEKCVENRGLCMAYKMMANDGV